MNELSRMVIVDPIISETIMGGAGRNGPASAERELMVAVLADAIECYWKYIRSKSRTGLRLYRDAHDWLFADNEQQPFSFRNICETLSLDPVFIRRGITQWKDIHGDPGDGGRATRAIENYRNMKRKLKGGRPWKRSGGLSRRRKGSTSGTRRITTG